MLNKIIVCGFLIAGSTAFAQNNTSGSYNTNDYKDPEQFEKFRKRRTVISAWQINELKEGAIVVRLKTNQTLIDELKKQGKSKLALEKLKEQHAMNKNTMDAYRDKMNFCKVYFIFSNSSDTLLKGARTGIFLDSNMKVNPGITMNEKFYLIAERDYGYNSSIGYMKEDSARIVVEKGNPVKEMAVVLKNKYGHQLKAPFPYFVKEKNFMDADFEVPINVTYGSQGEPVIDYKTDKTYLADLKEKRKGVKVPARTTGNSIVKIKKQFTYEMIAEVVDQLNDNLHQFHQGNVKPDLSRIDPEIKEFLY